MTNTPKPGEEFNNALEQLIQTVEQRVTREVTNYFLEVIDNRLNEHKEVPQSTEYDYCEAVGRIKELQELTKTLRDLN